MKNICIEDIKMGCRCDRRLNAGQFDVYIAFSDTIMLPEASEDLKIGDEVDIDYNTNTIFKVSATQKNNTIHGHVHKLKYGGGFNFTQKELMADALGSSGGDGDYRAKFLPSDFVVLKDQTRYGGNFQGKMKITFTQKNNITCSHPLKGDCSFDENELDFYFEKKEKREIVHCQCRMTAFGIVHEHYCINFKKGDHT